MIYEYVKNITLLAVFLALVEMILPSQKFSKYIKLVLGFVLMVNITLPFVDFKKYSWELKSFDELIHQDEIDYNYYVDVSMQMDNMAISEGVKHYTQSFFKSDKYYIDDVIVEFDINDDIVAFNEIEFYIKEIDSKEANDDKKADVIKIDTIEINGIKKQDNFDEKNDESSEILDLKNKVSKEYNLSLHNIYVKID